MISIVIITCNRKAEVGKSILSCLGKSAEEFEIIVIDNHSSDGTPEYVKALAIEKRFELRLVESEKNLGCATARDLAFGIVRGDIVFFLDDDAYVQSTGNCISDVAAFMRAHPQYPVVGTDIYNTTNNYSQHGTFPVRPGEANKNQMFYFVGASHFVNKTTINSDHMYPAEFFYGGEEYFLSFTLHKNNYSIYQYKDMLVHHAPSKSTRMSKEDIMLAVYSNAFNVKRYFTPALFLPVIWVVMFIRVFLKGIRKPSLFKKFVDKIRAGYNKEYRSPLTLTQLMRLMNIFGVRIVL